MLFFQLIFSYANAQVSVKGKVTNINGEALSGTTVKVKGTAEGTSTNNDGLYSLNISDKEGTLIFSYIGYETKEVNVGGRTEIDVVLMLENAAGTLSDVIIVGYGKQSREEVTTAVTKLDDKVLENIPYANVASAMQGTLSGVRVQSTSGQPGAAPRVIIRGGTSINNPNGASPLYIVDGITRTQINDLSSDDIESLQVLKDAASTAIYGARGSNGVVIITTKSGKAGKAIVAYSYDHTISKVGKMYNLVSARDYLELNRSGIVNRAPKFEDASSRLILPMGYGTGNDLTNSTAFTTQYLTSDTEITIPSIELKPEQKYFK